MAHISSDFGNNCSQSNSQDIHTRTMFMIVQHNTILSNIARRPGFSKGPTINIQTTITTIILSVLLLSSSSSLSSLFDVMWCRSLHVS